MEMFITKKLKMVSVSDEADEKMKDDIETVERLITTIPKSE